MVRIFIAHSSEDEWLIDQIAGHLRTIPVEPYLAKLEDPMPYPLPKKINSAIKSSAAMFVFLTPNVANNKNTRDVVNWEISAAYVMGRPIYVFREEGTEVPLMLNYITTYMTYTINQESLDEMADKVQDLASYFKQSEDKAKAAFGMILFLLGISFLGSLGEK